MSSHLSTEEKIDRMLLAQSSSTPSLTSLDAEDTFRVTGSASAARSMKQQQQQHRRRRSHRPTTRRFKRQQKQRNVQIALSLALCFMVVWYGSECQKHPEVAESKSHHVLGFLGLLQTLLVWACLCEAQKHHYEEGAQSGPATQHATTATTSSSSPIGGALRDIAADILSLFTNTRLVQGDTVYTESAANK
uniref:Uncharacterized protein n=1 Tax=Grammatophora oceanica TaxID=210454 RepID=A0A7S1VT87_9STRA